jgi:hypothetical protein
VISQADEIGHQECQAAASYGSSAMMQLVLLVLHTLHYGRREMAGTWGTWEGPQPMTGLGLHSSPYRFSVLVPILAR